LIQINFHRGSIERLIGRIFGMVIVRLILFAKLLPTLPRRLKQGFLPDEIRSFLLKRFFFQKEFFRFAFTGGTRAFG